MIHLDNVSVTYNGGCIALHPVKISFMRGQFSVLIGPSGAGKSTLLRCINFLTKPTAGSVSVDGLGRLDAGNVLRKHRRNTAMVFQQHQLIPRLSVLQNVLTGRLGYHTTVRSLFPLPKRELRIAFESLERVGLLSKANERVDALSGGQQQRVGIARALAQQPHIIIADEPVASLDPVTANNVLSLLHSICKEDNLSAVVSLHQVELAKAYADRIIGLSAGEIVFDGTPQALTANLLDQLYSGKDVQSPRDSVYCNNPIRTNLKDLAISEQES